MMTEQLVVENNAKKGYISPPNKMCYNPEGWVKKLGKEGVNIFIECILCRDHFHGSENQILLPVLKTRK